MEAIGEDLGRAYDAGSRLPRPARLRPVPSEDPLTGPLQASASGPGEQDVLDRLAAQLAAAALATPDLLATASYVEAADYAARIEGLARSVEYLQLVSAGAVDRTRTQAINDAATAKTRAARSRAGRSRAGRSRAGGSTGWITGWDATGFETLRTAPATASGTGVVRETDANWPGPPSTRGLMRPVVVSPADDGCRNTAEFLRLRLQIPIREARRRLALAQHVLPVTTITGEPLPPTRPHLAAALTPATELHASTEAGAWPGPAQGPAVSSHAATIITATLDRLQHHTTQETLDTIEHHLTTAATSCDPDFLTRLAQRWTDTIDADGTEPTEEALRHTQGAFIRKPRHGLHRVEIFATGDQYEHLLTVMNTATNPHTTTPNTETGTGTGTGSEGSTLAGSATAGDARGHIALPDLDRRTRAQKQLDGLVTAAKAALTTNTLPTTGGNRPQIIATINYQDLFPHTTGTKADTAASAGTGTSAGIGTGTGSFAFTGPVAAATLRKTACDADIIPALLGTNGEILDLGRKTRLFTPAQRLALTARDQGCAFPNCTIPAPWCEAHHITYWSQGGPTTTNNGALLCSHHHHLIHKEQWKITTTHGTPTFIPPPHLDPNQTPQQNHYFKPPPPPHPRE
ncbi:HNH endonuclease signature motif containing protein [Pseudarthrobacter defluvii]|uniref:HNH endonuclease signature motif containing protein n=1 Tax=Pseudarthrobacter defluvii TaxID=410837 RepID=UPI002578CB32|nr:HNH endonuclease signature motif containing protein [Pseudarthrobacter defluvii]